MTTTIDLTPAQQDLQRRLSGRLLLPGDPDTAAAVTPWNVARAVRPAAAVQALDAADVVEAVRWAGEHGLAVAVQATGHGVAAAHDGAVLVLTAGLDECTVHPDGWARVGAGVKWARVLEAAAPLGLAPLCGSSSDVGVVGLLTGGGIGPLARTHGVCSDRVRALEVVTGDGVLHRATPTQDAELFWGLRGGKGSLGVVTAVEIDLLPIAELYGGAVWFDGEHTAAVLHAWRDWSQDLPEQAGTSIAVAQLPPLPGVPEPLAGRRTVSVRFTWLGEPADGEALLAPLRAVAPVLLDGVGVLPYAAIDAVHGDPVDPMPVHEEAALLRSLPPQAVDELVAAAGPGSGSPQVLVEVRRLGGAVARAPRHPSAVCHRDAEYSLLTVGVPLPDPAPVVAHAARLLTALQPWAHEGLLPNFAPSSDPERIARCYDAEVLHWLGALAAQHDPARVLRTGHVVPRG